MMATNVSVKVTLPGGGKRFVVAVRDTIKHHKDIRKKWLDIIEKCKLTVQVESVSATTSKITSPNQPNFTLVKVSASSSPTLDQCSNQKGQTLPSEEELFKGCLIKDDAVTLASLVIFFSIPFSILQKLFQENPPELEEAILEIIFIIIIIIIIPVLVLQQMKGTNHLTPILRDGIQITANKKLLSLFFGLMTLTGGAHAEGSTKTSHQSLRAGNVWDKDNYFKAAAAVILTLMSIGSATAWWMLRRRATSEFAIDEGLAQSLVPRRSNPDYRILPELD